MKIKMIYLLACLAIVTVSCKKEFLEKMKSYDKYDESIFTNEVLTGQYIDRLYNYFWASYRSPVQNEASAGTGGYDDSKTKNTEEIGGTVSNWINPNKTLQLASEAEPYYGAAITGSVANTPYTRIRFCNFLLEKMDGIGQVLPESFRKTSKGQMYFLRAWQYFNLVRYYGGVPIELKVSLASSTDESIRTPRSTATEVFAQIVKDLDSAAALLPAVWSTPGTNYGRATSAAALAMKSRVLLTAASPLFNSDWDNSGSPKWQAALDAGLKAETELTAAGYGLYGSSAKDWAEMTYKNDNSFNKEAIIVMLLSNTQTSSSGYNNSWENGIRPKDHNGSGSGISAPKGMLDLFPLANGMRPTAANGYVDTFFFENRDPRFYRTFAFSGEKWSIKTNSNKTSFFYRWKKDANNYSYSGNNQTSSPAVVRKFSNPAADTTLLAFSGTDIFEYRYAELLLNIAECYAAKGDITNAIVYLGKIRNRVGIPSANNWGIGNLANKYEAIEACLYERRVELAYEGKRFWDIKRWLLYEGVSSTNPNANTTTKLGIPNINGTNRTGYYWQVVGYTGTADPLTAADKAILIDPDGNASDFNTAIGKLKTLYRTKLVMTPLDQAMDRDGNTPVNILFRPNYYLSGLTSTVLSFNPWLPQTVGWLDYDGAPGTFNSAQ